MARIFINEQIERFEQLEGVVEFLEGQVKPLAGPIVILGWQRLPGDDVYDDASDLT